VGFDFLVTEWPDPCGPAHAGTDDYLHEAALANDPCSKTFYDPERDGTRLSSLGVHEHWNNTIDKQYSRNLGTGNGIELVALFGAIAGDFDEDRDVDFEDLQVLVENWLQSPTPGCPGDLTGDDCFVNMKDFAVFAGNWSY
jgi:hypothetical protein